MMTQSTLCLANTKCQFKHASIQINLPTLLTDCVVQWGKKHIRDIDLYAEDPPSRHSRELESHVTILDGIQEKDPKRVLSLFKGIKPFFIELGRISLFKNEKFDVIKIEAFSLELHILNKCFKKKIQAIQTHPSYNPHVTIAFAKKNLYSHLEGNEAFSGLKFLAQQIQFSRPDGEYVCLDLARKRK